MTNAGETTGPIIVFDAMCVLCSANAQVVLRHDRRRRFRLASMQGEVGESLYRGFGIDPTNPETFILVEDDRALRESDAVIAIYSGPGGPWRTISVLKLVPHFLRDGVYRWVARNRYRIFGRRQTCWLPASDFADRLL